MLAGDVVRDDVLGLGRAPEHPVRDREHQRLELLVHVVHAGVRASGFRPLDEPACLSVTQHAVSLRRGLPRLVVQRDIHEEEVS